jgi:hypothetical protein
MREEECSGPGHIIGLMPWVEINVRTRAVQSMREKHDKTGLPQPLCCRNRVRAIDHTQMYGTHFQKKTRTCQ